MLEKDPKKRYSAEEALQDSWIINYSEKLVVDMPTLAKSLNNLKTFRVNFYCYFFN